MRQKTEAQQRLKELAGQVKQVADSSTMTGDKKHAFLDRAEAEAESLQTTIDNAGRANQFAAAGEKAFGGQVETKTVQAGGAPSPLQASDAQLKALWQASQNNMPFQVEIGAKGGFENNLVAKDTSPITEGGLSPQLPPVMMPNRALGLPYEPSRIMHWLPQTVMTGPSAEWIRHESNAAEPAGVGEAEIKPDVGMNFSTHLAKPQKLAALASITMEAAMDYPSFAQLVPMELTRALINTESNFVLNAGTSGGPTATFDGILATPGTLTRKVATDAKGNATETGLNAIQKAFVDLRTGPAFAEPDLVVINPATMGALVRSTDSSGRYLLDFISGPRGLTYNGLAAGSGTANETEQLGVPTQGRTAPTAYLWNVPAVESTMCPEGTAIVMSVAAGAAVGYQRLGMLLQFNPWGDKEWGTNTYSYRCEQRISLATPRPSAINIVTGLPGLTGAS